MEQMLAMLKASHVKISLNGLETRKFYFLYCFRCPAGVFELFSSLFVFFVSTVESWTCCQDAGPGAIPLWGGGVEKHWELIPFPVSTLRDGQARAFAHQVLRCRWKQFPSENLLSQNFNGFGEAASSPIWWTHRSPRASE